MRALFVVSDKEWSARARAFMLAARGLAARGHEVQLACADQCPVQVRATGGGGGSGGGTDGVPVVSLAGTSTAGTTMELRKLLRDVDVAFVHTEGELVMAASALTLKRGAGAVIRRVSPFAVASSGRGVKLVSRFSATGLLFSTEADRAAADQTGYRLGASVAPLAVDPAAHDAATAAARDAIGVPEGATLIVCVHMGGDRTQVLMPLRTLALLTPLHPVLHLAVVGDARADEMRMQGAAMGVNGRVTYLGARDDELSIIRAADVGWIAADGDAAAFAALDFMAARVPVLAHKTPLTEHYVADGVVGVLLPSADPAITAASVASFLARRDARVAMGKAGRTRLEREFPLDAMIRGYEAAMSSVAGGGGSGARSVA